MQTKLMNILISDIDLREKENGNFETTLKDSPNLAISKVSLIFEDIVSFQPVVLIVQITVWFFKSVLSSRDDPIFPQKGNTK